MASVTLTWRPVTRTGTLTFAVCMRFSGLDGGSHLEAFAEVNAAGHGILSQKILRSLTDHSALVDQVRPIHDRERLADIMVRNENSETGVPKIGNDLLDIIN